MSRDNVYILIHSPLVGPLTWSLVADAMRQRGLDVLVPTLVDSIHAGEPFWKQHAGSVSRAAKDIPRETPCILVAHSGAGPLLPVVRQNISNPVHAYVFVDAGIPRSGATRLDLMKLEDADWAAEFEQELKQGGRFPTWSIDDLRDVIPDETLRKKLVAELNPRGLDFFNEPIPVFDGWPDAPCVYIQFSEAYAKPAEQAREQGWITEEIKAGHFHMLVDPVAITEKILEMVD